MNDLGQASQKVDNGLWLRVVDSLKEALSEQTLRAWIEPIRFVAFEKNILTLEVPDKFYGDWLKEHYDNNIISALQKCSGIATLCAVHYQIASRDFTDSSAAKKAPPKPSLKTKKNGPQEPSPTHPFSHDFTLNYRYSFDHFVVGPGNRFAHAAAMAVAESPARAYNPLFVYGPVGLGKTHLLQAIAHSVLEKSPESRVIFISSEKFTNQLITAIQTRSTQTFRERYRNVDVLLIDDIHFIANKEATQEEFFHTFNALYDAHKQIVVTSDRPPKDISSLEERLVSRFEWGLVTDIQPPDLETRTAILRKKLENSSTHVPDEVTGYIASRIKSNIRELEGALLRVMAYSSLIDKPLTLALAQEVLKESVAEEASKINIDTVQKKVSEYFNLPVSDMRIKKRTKAIVYPRQIAMYLVRRLTEYSLPEIGEYFGGRDHTTVLHAISKIEHEVRDKNEVKRIVDILVDKIKSGN
ncbi:MAG: chromosomal replication initiator protein DnaA [Candidatus Omnitrophica bacterium]|nr:chromosomal replication initiator protein DnaA [Candidatus Omnitrophota bacterium]